MDDLSQTSAGAHCMSLQPLPSCFPPEILSAIISFVSDDTYQLQEVMATCKEWYDMGTSVVRKVRVHRSIPIELIWQLMDRYPRLESLDLEEAPPDMCIISTLTLLEAAAGRPGQQAPFFIEHFPRHITELRRCMDSAQYIVWRPGNHYDLYSLVSVGSSPHLCCSHPHAADGEADRTLDDSWIHSWRLLLTHLAHLSPVSAKAFIKEIIFGKLLHRYVGPSAFIPLCNEDIIADLVQSHSTSFEIYQTYSTRWSDAQQLAFFRSAIIHDKTTLVRLLHPIMLPDAHAIPPVLLCGALLFTEGDALHELLQYGPLCPEVSVPESLLLHLMRGMAKTRETLMPFLQLFTADCKQALQPTQKRYHEASALLQFSHEMIYTYGDRFCSLLPLTSDIDHHWSQFLDFCYTVAKALRERTDETSDRPSPLANRLLKAIEKVCSLPSASPFPCERIPLPSMEDQVLDGIRGKPCELHKRATVQPSVSDVSSTDCADSDCQLFRAGIKNDALMLCILVKEMVTRSQEQAAYLREAMAPQDTTSSPEDHILRCIKVAREARRHAYGRSTWRKLVDSFWTPELFALQAEFETLIYGNPFEALEVDKHVAWQKLVTEEITAYNWIMSLHEPDHQQYKIQLYYAVLLKAEQTMYPPADDSEDDEEEYEVEYYDDDDGYDDDDDCETSF